MYRRFISLLLAFALLFAVTACGPNQGSQGGTTTTVSGQNGENTEKPEIHYQEGVHHAAIIYACDRDSEGMKPFVARMENYRPTGEYLFDTYIFLRLLNTSGVFADSAGAKKEDWEDCLDTYFRDNTNIFALEGALKSLENTIGKPETKRKAIISIPHPHKATENFGDVDGDGVDEDFLDDNDRKKVLNWYVQEAIDRFNSYNFEHVELWGFYWDTESIPSDEAAVSMASDVVHDAGYKFMWIPYYEAPGYEKGNDYFDVTIMQPNYAFNDWTVDGKVGPERLENTWTTCQKYGYGIEMELDTLSLGDISNFQRYMAYGAADRLGYQFHVNGYFLGGGRFTERTYESLNKGDQAVYNMVCDYVTGKKVPDPDVYYPVAWDGKPFEVEAKTTDRISNVFVSADTKTLGNWNGVLTAEFYRDGKWVEAGWLAVEEDATAQTIRTLTIPTDGTAEKVRLSVKGDKTFPDKAIRSVSLDHTGARTEVNYCYGKTYTLSPDPASRPYDDFDGNELTNGITDNYGLGWWDTAARVVIDLGSAKDVDSLELFVKRQEGAGISLPQLTYATFSEDKPADMVLSGLGALPTNFRMEKGTLTEVQEVTANNKVYRADFKTEKQKTRYISIYAEPTSARWMMLTELRVKCGGTEIPIESYALKTRTRAELGTMKADAGVQLTNGSVEYGFGNGCVGWDVEKYIGNKTLTVDLEQSQLINKITLYSVSAPANGAFCARSAVFYTSEDGVNWTQQGKVDKSALVQTGERSYPVPMNCKLKQPTQARYLKVVITGPNEGMCGISEITAS